ncbi:MAG TPA: 7TM-DISM domain-containing protein, partial [Flavobacteriales bacterium]|nr:7TM-DISM domain-containing protein [Flavobacteriales bacterium]
MVPITQVDGFVAVGKNAEILVDPAAEYTVSQAIRSTDYEPCGTEVPNLGNSRAAHWIRFAIKNGTY